MDLLTLQAQIREGIADLFPESVWVRAEIGQWSPRANGHCYLSLTQSERGKPVAEVRAMIWKWQYPSIKAYFESETGQALQAGITVLVRVRVNYSELYGISLFVEDIDPAFTLGEQAQERKRTIERLKAGGYLEMQQELCLPALPSRLAVVSSRTAAGLEDFLNHLAESGYAIHADLFEALMQGESAPESIRGALDAILEAPDYDAVLILRGGGSDTDLACFDDYDLAVAVATCPLPVLTAIGHERDYHVADMVANRFVKTPTALADVFIDLFAAEDVRLADLGVRIGSEARRRVQDALRETERRLARIRLGLQRRTAALDAALAQTATRIAHGLDVRFVQETNRMIRLSARIARGATANLHAVEKGLDDAVRRLRFGMGAVTGKCVAEVALKEARIASADPRTILSRGYVLVTDDRNRLLKTVERVSVGSRIGVRFSDGALRASVSDVYREDRDREKTATA